MIDKLPFFFDFDRNRVTSLMFADFPTILLTSSPFQKYVPGIIEACVLAFYDKINTQKYLYYIDDKNSVSVMIINFDVLSQLAFKITSWLMYFQLAVNN